MKSLTEPLHLANVRTGLALCPDPDDLSYFLSTHAHRPPYVTPHSMPLSAIAHLLQGGTVIVHDGSHRRNHVPDSLVKGLGTWALIFGRAINNYTDVPWATREMLRACWSNESRKTVQIIRRLGTIYGYPECSTCKVPQSLFVGITLPDIESFSADNPSPSWYFAGQKHSFSKVYKPSPGLGPQLLGMYHPTPATFDDKPEEIRKEIAEATARVAEMESNWKEWDDPDEWVRPSIPRFRDGYA